MKRMKADGSTYEEGRCFECRNGEHEDFDDDVRMTLVRDPDTHKVYRRGYLCSEHRGVFESDGFIVATS